MSSLENANRLMSGVAQSMGVTMVVLVTVNWAGKFVPDHFTSSSTLMLITVAAVIAILLNFVLPWFAGFFFRREPSFFATESGKQAARRGRGIGIVLGLWFGIAIVATVNSGM